MRIGFMPPIALLGILILGTISAVLAEATASRRRQRVFHSLAAEYHMHYSPADPLRLTPRVAAHFPIPGAAGIRLIDLLYRTDEKHHHYVFTAEYTIGVVGPKHRIRQAAALTESKIDPGQAYVVRLASLELSLVEQYRSLIS